MVEGPGPKGWSCGPWGHTDLLREISVTGPPALGFTGCPTSDLLSSGPRPWVPPVTGMEAVSHSPTVRMGSFPEDLFRGWRGCSGKLPQARMLEDA